MMTSPQRRQPRQVESVPACHRWLRNPSDWDGTGFHLANAVRGGAASCHHRPDRGARANRSAAGKPWVGRLKERHIPGASSRAHPGLGRTMMAGTLVSMLRGGTCLRRSTPSKIPRPRRPSRLERQAPRQSARHPQCLVPEIRPWESPSPCLPAIPPHGTGLANLGFESARVNTGLCRHESELLLFVQQKKGGHSQSLDSITGRGGRKDARITRNTGPELQESCCLSHLSPGDIGLVCLHHPGGRLAGLKPMRHGMRCFFRCPALLDVLGRGHWILPRSRSCRNFTLASREKWPRKSMAFWLR